MEPLRWNQRNQSKANNQSEHANLLNEFLSKNHLLFQKSFFVKTPSCPEKAVLRLAFCAKHEFTFSCTFFRVNFFSTFGFQNICRSYRYEFTKCLEFKKKLSFVPVGFKASPVSSTWCVWHEPYIKSLQKGVMCDVSHSYVWRDSFMCGTWLIHMCHMTHSYVRHDSIICVTWLIHMCHMTHSYVWHDSLICVTWLIHVWHDSFICVTWLIDLCDMTHLYVWHDSLIRVPWLNHMCDMTHSYVWHDSPICVIWLIHVWPVVLCVPWLIHIVYA